MGIMQRVVVTGKVHQVGFRDFTVRRAQSLGVTGWVRNRQDGSVEILASGEDEAVAALVDACRQGPPLARVDHVEAYNEDGQTVKGFTKRFTA
ncbi:MAG: acylphosphatase [Sphingomonas sp.]|uniref:acylphosphatase n=1 Tax=Sphingomonas sp. TaxID=28214 RepID=UPI001AC98FF8|nr:acylphosphatase [Sphingomonas sp.]MBN8807446.1 acylphosphatase [Sphingomonas sp.]